MVCKNLVELVLIVSIIVFISVDKTKAKTKDERRRLKEKAVEMFLHAYNSYMQYAYPADELMPLTCQGRTRDTKPGRGDIDDALGQFSLTLIDTLDTLAVLGLLEEFEHAIKLVIRDVSFDTDVVVSVFETNIRVLGGLLGAHVVALDLKKTQNVLHWYTDQLLKMAKDLGYRMLPAFNTSTGIPYPRVNLRHGLCKVNSRAGHERDTCTACAGTMILEFAALSRLSGDPVFEEKAQRAMEFLWKQRHRSTDLVGTVINIHNGDWVRRESGVGAGIDSYYEYLLKAYILLGDDTYLDRFNKHYSAIMQWVNQGPLLVDVHMHRPDRTSRNFMDALLAFWPGLQVLKGDLKSAIQIHEMLYQVTKRHNFLPEAFTTDFRVHWGQHPLRPEFVESTYFLYKATGDPYYLEAGESVLTNLEMHARVPCGFAAIKDVTTGQQEDQMDSYVLAETFKYLYLLFAEPKDLVLNVDSYVFTTEAHLLPLTLAMQNNSMNITKVTVMPQLVSDEDENFERSCRNVHLQFQGNLQYYAQNIRKPMENYVERLCPKPKHTRSRRLRAAEFIAGKQEHVSILKEFGIRLVTLQDGRVQLLHTASDAATPEDAQEGLMFMQEMIELSKSQQSDNQQEPRVIQLMSPPFHGKTWLSAGPALFGKDLKSVPQGVRGSIIRAAPYDGCAAFSNGQDVQGRIVVVERGGCMFIDKARNIELAGGIGGIVIDNHPDSSSTTSPLFAMSGDGKTEVAIPFVFLFHKEGEDLLAALEQSPELSVLMALSPQTVDDVKDKGESIIRVKHVDDNVIAIMEKSSGGDVKYEVSAQFSHLNILLNLISYGNSDVEARLAEMESAVFKVTETDGITDLAYDGVIPMTDNVPDEVYVNMAVRKLLKSLDVSHETLSNLLVTKQVANAFSRAVTNLIQSVFTEQSVELTDDSVKLFKLIPVILDDKDGEARDYLTELVEKRSSLSEPRGPPEESEHLSQVGKYPEDFEVRVASPSMQVSSNHFYINAVEKIIYVTQEEYDKYLREAKRSQVNHGNTAITDDSLDTNFQESRRGEDSDVGSVIEGGTSELKTDQSEDENTGLSAKMELSASDLNHNSVDSEERRSEEVEGEGSVEGAAQGSENGLVGREGVGREGVGTESERDIEQALEVTARVFQELKRATLAAEGTVEDSNERAQQGTETAEELLKTLDEENTKEEMKEGREDSRTFGGKDEL